VGVEPAQVGVVLVDHGSRRDESNAMLLDVVALYGRVAPGAIVEPAHMELAEPSLATAFERCVRRGARLVVVHPYFLAPGRHGHEDIPRLAAEAAARFPAVRWLVTDPLGPHPKLAEVIDQRVRECLANSGPR
jgi:sirohydrochlorin ferrochelatase